MITGINNISFNGTYRISREMGNNTDSLIKVPSLMENDFNDKYEIMPEKNKERNPNEYTYIFPDPADETVENVLNKAGIKFKRFNAEEMYSEEGIKARTKLEPGDEARHKLVYLNRKKFEEIYKDADTQKGDMQEAGKVPLDIRCHNYKRYLKTMQDIYPVEATFTENANGQLQIVFDDRRATCKVMEEAGFNSIPFSLEPGSLRVAQAYGLIDNIK